MAARTSLTVGALVLVSTVISMSAQSRAETYTATASVKTAGGASLTAPVAIDVTGWTSDADRKRLAGVLKSEVDYAALPPRLPV